MPDAIPHEALARAVRAAFGAGARIVAAERLFGDASSRRYVRLRLADGGAPPTVVAMLLGADRFPLGSDELGERAASDELPFVSVARYLAARGFPVPIIHRDAAASDSLLLLEDVGDTTLWAAASAHPADVRPLFAAAVDLLAAFQVAGARHPDPSCLGGSRAGSSSTSSSTASRRATDAASRPTSARGCSPRWTRSLGPSSRERPCSSIATSWPGTSTCGTGST